jgi:hypothetical protein
MQVPPGTVVHAIDPALTAAVASQARLVELEDRAALRSEQKRVQAREDDAERRALDAAAEADRRLQEQAEMERDRAAKERRVLAASGIQFTPAEQARLDRADAIWDED